MGESGYRFQLPESCDFPVPRFSGDGPNGHNVAMVGEQRINGEHVGAPAPKVKYLAMVLNDLEAEKATLLNQLEAEDRDRHAYFAKLEAISKEIRELPVPTDSPSLECELERRRLEQEAQRLQDAMLKTLGPAGEGLKRREARLLALRNIDQKIFAVSSLLAERQREEDGEATAVREPREFLQDIQDEEGVPDAIASHPQFAASDEKVPFPYLQDPTWLQVNALWASMSSNNVTDERTGVHDTASLVSFTSSIHSMGASRGINTSSGGTSSGGIGTKVEVVYNLLSLLASHDRENISKTLLAMSENPDTCTALRQAGVLPLLVQLLHGGDLIPPGTSINSPQSPPDNEARRRASQALRNIVLNQADDKRTRKEARILKLLETVRNYSEFLREKMMEKRVAFRDELKGLIDDPEMQNHPGGAVASLLKFSFEEDHRSAIAHLGGLHALAELIQVDTDAHGIVNDNQHCQTMRRYVAMTLTNLTFGDSLNKSLLCAIKGFLLYMARILRTPCEELRQVYASVIRNLSWRADMRSKEFLKDSGIVRSLVLAAMEATKENTLRAVLSALWNLSGHCSENKVEICQTDGAVAFLVDTLLSNTVSIVENGGGILRNISNHIAMKEELREILRRNNCISVLLQQLRSPSLTVVSNACGTLWNLSARSAEDQKTMFDLGAVPLLRALVHSRHKMIALGASAALKNLLTSKPHANQYSSETRSRTPSLQARKQRAFEQEIDPNIDEICENIESPSPREERPQDPFDRTVMQAIAYRSLGQRYRSISPNILGRQMSNDDMLTSIRSDTQLEKRYSQSPLFMNRDLASGGGCRSSSLDRQLNRQHYEQPSSRYAHPKVAWKSCEDNLRTHYQKDTAGQRSGAHNFQSYDDDPDQPIDYSVKYAEMSAIKVVQTKVANTRDSSTSKKVMVYGAYSETNIEEPEQPTNFGARYGERDDIENKGKETQQRPDFADDAVKTFYTEGTPYETPANFSHATSVTDLRDPSLIKLSDKGPADAQEVPNSADRFEDDYPENEKPQTYLTEGTPGFVSRISSENSIEIENDNEKVEAEKVDERKSGEEKEPARSEKGKAVTFGTQAEFYPEQTPLMFSRASSIESLDSVRTPGLQAQQEDGCSVVSEFSRLVSRAVSPSDLPDSPCQTMPPSPRRSRRATGEPRSQAPSKPIRQNVSAMQQPKDSVFGDSIRTFQQEGTPALTRAGSPLSCLSLQNEKPIDSSPPLNRPQLNQEDFGDDEIKNYGVEGTPGLTRTASLSSLCRDDEEVSPPGMKAIPRIPLPIPLQELEKVTRNTLTMKEELDAVNGLLDSRLTPVAPLPPPVEFFEDAVRNYKEEGTPGLTRASSFSALTLDDEVEPKTNVTQEAKKKDHSPEPTSSGTSWNTVISAPEKVGTPPAAAPSVSKGIPQNGVLAAEDSDGSGSDDDNILAMCISSGMQAALKKKPTVTKKPIPRSTSMPLKNITQSKLPTPKKPEEKQISPMGIPKSLSTNTIGRFPESDSSSDPEDDQILAKCIQSAISKARPTRSSASSAKEKKETKLHHALPAKGPGHLCLGKPESKAPSVTSPGKSQSTTSHPRDCRRSRSTSGRVEEPLVSTVPRTTHQPQLLARLGQPVPAIPAVRQSRNRHLSQPDKKPEEHAAAFVVENTPVSFSRNSSLSSLSIDSDDAGDEELLRSCITRGMMKKPSAPSESSSKTKPKPQLKMNSKYQPAPIGGLERRQGDGKENSKGNSPKLSRAEEKVELVDKAKESKVEAVVPPKKEVEVEEVLKVEVQVENAKPQFELVVSPVCEPISSEYDSGIGKSCKESMATDEKDQDTTESLETVMPNDDASLNQTVVNPFGNEGFVFPDNMTESTLLKEARTVEDELRRDLMSSSNYELALDGVSSLTASMMVDDWPDGKEGDLKRQASLNRHYDSRTYRVNKPTNLLKQAIGSNIDIDAAKLSAKCVSQDSLSASCHSNIDSIKPPSNLTDPDVMGASFVNSTSGSISSGMFASKNGNLSMKSSFNADMIFEPERQEALLEELVRMEREVAEKSQQTSPELALLTISGLTAQIQGLSVDGGEASKDSSEKSTPKERRKSDKERYYTYTLQPEDLKPVAVQVETEKKKSPKEKRAENKERFRTRTISASDLAEPVAAAVALSSETKEPTIEPENEVFKVTQAELETIQKDANMIIKRLGGSDASEELLDYETLSLVSNDSMSNIGSRKASKAETYRCDDDTGESEPELDEEEARGPRILKPGEGPANQEAKGIRGRKKVSTTQRIAMMQQSRPHSNPNVPAKPVPRASPLAARRGRSASPASSVQSDASHRGPSPLASVRTNRTIALRQANSLQKLQPPKATESPMRKVGSNRSVHSTSPRQGEEKSPSSKGLQKLDPNCSGSKSSISSDSSVKKTVAEPPKLKKEGTFTKETPIEPPPEGKRVPPKVPPKPKLRNDAVQPVKNDKPNVKKLKVPFEGEGSSADSDKKITPPKKQVSSKIANLWRQVEESRGKQKKDENDTRKWIGKEKPEPEPKPDQRSRPLVSSTTFDKLPTATVEPVEEKKSLGVRLTLKFPRFGKSRKSVPEPSPSSSDTKSPETPQLVEACFSDESPADSEKPKGPNVLSRLGSFVFVPGQHVESRTIETITDASPTSDDSHNGNKRPKKVDNKTGSVLVTTV